MCSPIHRLAWQCHYYVCPSVCYEISQMCCGRNLDTELLFLVAHLKGQLRKFKAVQKCCDVGICFEINAYLHILQ